MNVTTVCCCWCNVLCWKQTSSQRVEWAQARQIHSKLQNYFFSGTQRAHFISWCKGGKKNNYNVLKCLYTCIHTQRIKIRVTNTVKGCYFVFDWRPWCFCQRPDKQRREIRKTPRFPHIRQRSKSLVPFPKWPKMTLSDSVLEKLPNDCSVMLMTCGRFSAFRNTNIHSAPSVGMSLATCAFPLCLSFSAALPRLSLQAHAGGCWQNATEPWQQTSRWSSSHLPFQSCP